VRFLKVRKSGEIYKATQEAQGGAEGAQPGPDANQQQSQQKDGGDDVTDVDFEEVK
jgi:molecular chaperone DnaK